MWLSRLAVELGCTEFQLGLMFVACVSRRSMVAMWACVVHCMNQAELSSPVELRKSPALNGKE